MNDFTLPEPRPSYRLSAATNDDAALEALRGWHVRIEEGLERMHAWRPLLYSGVLFQPDDLLVREVGPYKDEDTANEDLGKDLSILKSRLQSGIAIIEEQLAADTGGSGPPTKTSSGKTPKKNDGPSHLGLIVNKDKQTVQRPGTEHTLELYGDEWTMFKLAFDAGSDGVTKEKWKPQHAGEWGEASRKSKSRLNDKLAALRVALAKGQGLRLIETE